MALSFQQETILKLLDDKLKRIENDANSMERKFQDNMSIITLILGISSLLSANQTDTSQDRIIIYVGIVAIYLLIIYLWFRTVTPRIWKEPLKSDWKEAMENAQKDDEDFFVWLADSYLKAIEYNRKLQIRKASNVRVLTICVAIEILLVLLSTMF